ncbi:outer membrane protein assembly factor BamB family protein [Methanolobus psychrotolerans]|uniref:outer membrane protein assembly factor BamB family protein n=1 Tax=Methanolobus psychrotolerans TaxID=1874706 RepID=UPI000B9168EF|nr:PQQ-binding-like beta-propeller repeat protein [Methanolobus psychrotolerans]
MRTLLLISSIFIFLALITPSGATIWSAINDSTLSEALSEANENDIIYLNPGNYTVAVSLTKNGLSLIGKNANEVTFNLSGSNLKMSAKDCVLKGVSIINSPKGVEVKASGCEIRKCIFDGLTYRTGIYIKEDNTVFTDNVVSNCTGTDFAVYGLGDECTYSGNTFINNSCAGLSLYTNSDKNVVCNNVFRQNKYGIYIGSAGRGNQIYLNDFIDNDENIIATNPPSIEWNSPEFVAYTYNDRSWLSHLGNYWGEDSGSDVNGDGILESPYTVSYGAGTDSYPLASTFETYIDMSSESADLKVDSLYPVSLVADQPNRIRVNVSNIGETDADAFKVILYHGTDSLGEEVIPYLAAGSSAQASFTLLPPAGAITLNAVVDIEGSVVETLESNNEISATLTSETIEVDENWFQFHKDEQHTGYYPGDGPDDATLLWVSDDINAVGSSSPVIAEGTVFVNCGDSVMSSSGDDGSSVTGLDMYTGETIGTFGNGCTAWGSWTSPCYYDGNVYCGRSDSVNGGDLIVNGKRYVGDYDGYRYYCTYAENGTSVWTKTVNGLAMGTPAYSDGMVYLTSCKFELSGDVYCVDAETGDEIWHISTPSGHDTSGTASVYNDILYFTTYNWVGTGDIYAVDKYDGTILWRKTIQRTDSCPAVAYGNVYVCGGCPGYSKLQTYCFDAVTGDELWNITASYSGIGAWTCSPVVADDKCYVGKIDSTMYSYSAIYAFDAYTGNQLWSSSGGGASPAISEGILYTVGNDGKVYAYGSISGPHAEFTGNVSSGNVPLTVSFTDMSADNITGWQWDFDNDGVIDSTEQNPVHVYESTGEYTVSLKVTNDEGTDTEVKDAYIEVTEENDDEWNIWDDPDSEDGVKITTDELQDAIHCWLNDVPITDSGDMLTTDRLQEVIHEWLEN